ncbi:lipid II:glycine glycyltransferase FemX [Haloarchaeobius sp. DFWS5]|uniref:lipid II:glycine glycyltransferase FemX n=1 Tax=Haloarchaeobius sp. DFWS5 TaxID=3446114 RepID=UPI003EB9CDB7
MSIEIHDASATDELDDWNRHVERSSQGTVFHRLEFLRVLARNSGTTIHPLVGYKGNAPVGIFPVFELSKFGVSAVFSPPPGLLVPFLGPALCNFEQMSQRKQERRHERFVEGCFEWIESTIGPRYEHLRASPGYDDIRPYSWNDFSSTPYYTYQVDLTQYDDGLLKAFSRSCRRNIRDADPDRYEVTVGDEDAVGRIHNIIEDRYAEQDLGYPLEQAFLTDVYRELTADYVRPYQIFLDGKFVGGVLTVEAGDTIFRWQGAGYHDVDLPVNDILDWHIIEDAVGRDRTRYDLVGANTRRLTRYKAKFAPELVPYYGLERGTPEMTVLASLYKRNPLNIL